MEQIRALLERYTQPCAEDCEHSQCPLLRELHALVISDTLERARLTVKPIVDRERAGEFVGDLMDMRLHASPVSPSPTPEQDEPFAAKHFVFGPCVHSMVKPDCPSCCQSHAVRLEMQLGKLEHSTALPLRERIERAVREHMRHCFDVYKGVPPTVDDWVGGALHYVMWGIERDLPLTEPLAAPPSTQPSARVAAEEFRRRVRQIIDTVIGSSVVVETRFFSQPQEADMLEDRIAALLTDFPSVQPVEEQKCTCCGKAECDCGPFIALDSKVIDDPCRICGKCINHCPHQ